MTDANRKSDPPAGRPLVRVVAAVIREGERYLITQRQQRAVLPGLWEFPGGRANPEETDQQALKREVAERLCVDVNVGDRLSSKTHDYDGYTVDLRLYDASISDGSPSVGNIERFQWVKSSELDQYEFPPADQASMDALLGLRKDK